MRGIAHVITIYSSVPSVEQIAIYSVLIRSLRELKDEYIIFEFEDCDKDTNGIDDLIFYQLCVDHDRTMHVEFRLGPPGKWRLYARECSVEEAVDLFNLLNKTRKSPILDGWRDTTAEVTDASRFLLGKE